ncbi:MAG TPA: bifunctional diaminohydroxyphosphoribosylaminopyrimidine deaminase/5-amino-6-(5-phosphoribosylamino)uracil reductase RibD [Actinomycetota bacterium]|nr:bifunctional diaminohydroxyphosphoribosylaminopyrimidine deaminase/5-amino-6-(5-phosphoribosylamino)uracil reductase RibD [Actinomycetota bacterium]
MSVTEDQRWMKMALRRAARGEGKTSPNPMVGAVVVKDGHMAGSGWHHSPGSPHAEVLALIEAGDQANGSTMFVTLEPCAHQGRTPPCVDSIIRAGVARVVACTTDPDPRVAGQGMQALEAAGIDTDLGLMSHEALRLNQAYFVHRTRSRPFVTYKSASSLDGKMAALDGSSKWITGEKARKDVQRLRRLSDAICTGIGTVLADDPMLTVRGLRSCAPRLRIVVDSEARIPVEAKALSPDAPTMIVTALPKSDPRVLRLEGAGASVLSAPGRDGRVFLPRMLRDLAERGIVSLLLEGGPTLAGAFAAENLIDRYVLYVAPKLIGGNGSLGLLEGWAAQTIGQALELKVETIRRVGTDLRIVAYPLGSNLDSVSTRPPARDGASEVLAAV